MPRAYTEAEQAAIRARLLAEGERRFAEHGLHAVTIRALTQAAGIGKGSFYLFFDSKEALFFAIQEHLETRFKAELQQELEALPPDPAALIEHLVLASMARMETHPFLHHLADPEVLGALMQRLPPSEAGAAHDHQPACQQMHGSELTAETPRTSREQSSAHRGRVGI